MVMALSDMLWEPDEQWREAAACAGLDDALFFPVGEEDAKIDAAKAVCAACPVRDVCLQYAIATNQTEGIWGGMTGAERRRLRRRMRDRQRRAS
jgi:WhiB family redox-sensing transcriptional regulator